MNTANHMKTDQHDGGVGGVQPHQNGNSDQNSDQNKEKSTPKTDRIGRSYHKLTFPFEKKPIGEDIIEIASGVFWARIPLPWSLDHINVYLFDDGDSYTLIDTGTLGTRGQEAWETLLAGPLSGKPIKRVIATHMHPDHVGLAGWICEKFDAEFYMSSIEYLTAQFLWQGASDTVPDYELDFLFKAGVHPSLKTQIEKIGYGGFKKGVYELPPQYNRLEDGGEICFGNRRWKVIIGRGHSPEHVSLYCLDEPLLISGDQILPSISSNVSVYSKEPNANPLAQWLVSLKRMMTLEASPLVLPSHGPVFMGMHERCQDLIDGHIEQLKALSNALLRTHEKKDPSAQNGLTAVEAVPILFPQKLSGFEFYMALGETLAHINLLLSTGDIAVEMDGTVARYSHAKQFEAETMMDKLHALPGVALRNLSDFDL